MALVTDTTQIKLISKLSGTSSFDSSDVLLLQRGFKSYKFNYSDLLSALPDDSTLEALSNKLQIKDSGVGTSQIANNSVELGKLDAIDATTNGKVIGALSGNDSPILIDLYDDDALFPDSDSGLATQQSIKAYIDNSIASASQLTYSGVDFNIPVTTAFTDLDLSSVVGTTRAIVYFELTFAPASIDRNIFVRRKGSIITPSNAITAGGWGASGGGLSKFSTGNGFSGVVITNSFGVIEIISNLPDVVTFKVAAYQTA